MQAGAVVVDRFEVDGLAGSGGMGTVWKARDRLHGGSVALKFLMGHRQVERSRFLREAVLLSQLRHPAIVRYVAHGVTPAGELFLAMEWLEGEDLSHWLARQRLDLRETQALLVRVLEALAAAHERGIVHRDIKPSNLFLVRRLIDQVTLIDFGVARVPHATALQTRTETGTIVGTPGYMPPEQVLGEGVLDGRVDIFALGCVAFECMSGRPAFVGESAAHVFRKILFEDAPRLRDFVSAVPDWLDRLVQSMTSRRAEDRPRDAAELARQLASGQVDDGSGRADSARLRQEARLVTVIVTEPAATSSASRPDQPVPPDTTPEAPAPSGSTQRTPRAEVVELLPTSGDAVDAAVASARVALTMLASLPGASIALVTYRRDGAARGESAPAAPATNAEAPDGPATPSVLLDEATAGLLDLQFEIVRSGPQAFLGAERSGGEARLVAGKATPCVGRD